MIRLKSIMSRLRYNDKETPKYSKLNKIDFISVSCKQSQSTKYRTEGQLCHPQHVAFTSGCKGAAQILIMSQSEEKKCREGPWNSLPILIRAKPGRDDTTSQPEPIRKNLVPSGQLSFNCRNGEWILGDNQQAAN